MPSSSPSHLGPAARNLRSLFNTLASLTGAVQAIARDIQDGIEDIAASGLNVNSSAEFNGYTNESGNLVVVNTPGTNNSVDEEENRVATLLTPFGLGNITTNAITQPEQEITPAVTNLLETLAMLPQSTRDAALRTYFRDLKDFTGQLPQAMFPMELAPPRESEGTSKRLAAEATGSQQTRATRVSTIPSASASGSSQVRTAPPAASHPVASTSQVHPRNVPQLPPIACLDTSFEPVLTDAVWTQLQTYDNPLAALIVHFLATRIPPPKPVLISHLGASITVIRDWQDEYLVMPGVNAPAEIVDGIIQGRLTAEKILEGKKVAGAKRMSAHGIAGLEIEYKEFKAEEAQAPVAGPSTLSAANLRYTPDQTPQAGPFNVPHSPLRRSARPRSPSQRQEDARPYPSPAARQASRSHAPSPNVAAPTRFAQELARINATNEAFNARKPSELYVRAASPVGDRSLRRHAAITEDMILISDPRHGGMGELQRAIHARNPRIHTAPGTRVRLQRSNALEQDDILRLSRGSNLQETVVAREEFSRRRRESHEEAIQAQEEKRRGKKRARDEEEVEVKEEVKAEKPVSEVPASRAKRQKRAAGHTTTQPPAATVDTSPVAGPSAATVAAPQAIEQTQLRRSTRSRRAPKPPAPLVVVPAPAAKKPRKKAAGSSSKGKGRNGAA